jgi:hypothetical protein
MTARAFCFAAPQRTLPARAVPPTIDISVYWVEKTPFKSIGHQKSVIF